VHGFAPVIVEKRCSSVTVLPQLAKINVNTAPKEVLSALFYTFPTSAIEQLVSAAPLYRSGAIGAKASNAGGRCEPAISFPRHQKQLFRGHH